MSIVSDCSADTTPQLKAMSDLSAAAVEVALSPATDTPSTKSSGDVIATRSGTDWVPIFNEIPIASNTLNIAINSGEIRPNVTALTTTTRTIAPKPVTTGTGITFRPDFVSGKHRLHSD